MTKQQKNEKQLPLLLQALAAVYDKDLTKPGIVLSYVPDDTANKPYYASICRYERYDQKKVINHAYGKTPADAIYELVSDWFKAADVLSQLKATL